MVISYETSEHEDTLDSFYEKFIELKLTSILWDSYEHLLNRPIKCTHML